MNLRRATTTGLSLFCEHAERETDHLLCEDEWCACPCHTSHEGIARDMREILTGE